MGPEQDVVPQAQVSVTCFGTGTSPASGNATSTTISATVFLSSGPPYSTATGSSSSTVGGAAASASAGSGTRSATAGMGSGTVIPFTGDAVKAAGSAGLAFFAFVLGSILSDELIIAHSLTIWIGRIGNSVIYGAYLRNAYTGLEFL